MIEQKALDNTTITIFASEWVAKLAIEYYHQNKNKIIVLPFGSAYKHNINEQEILNRIEAKDLSEINLLFIGTDWERNGGDSVVIAVISPNEWGINVNLHIIGIKVKISEKDNKNIKHYGYLSKSNNKEKELFDELFAKAHFFILPTTKKLTVCFFLKLYPCESLS